jgi:hypothetical protein
VTFDEALRELAVEATASADETRRAYLRLLKTRKPEVDPDGFRRLREAYEVARRRLQFLPNRVLRPVPPVVADVEGVAEVPDAIVADVAPTPLVVASPAPEEPKRAVGVAGISKLTRAGDFEGAARGLVEELAQARVSSSPGGALVLVSIDVMLKLHETGNLDLSMELGRSVHHYLRDSGVEARLLENWAATKWAVVRELQQLPPTFPPELRSAIAKAVLATQPGLASGAVYALRRESRAKANTAAATLRNCGPLLAQWYAADLSRDPTTGTRSSGWGRAVLGSVVAMGLFRLLTSFVESSRAPIPKPVPSYPPHVPSADERVEALAVEILRDAERGDCDSAHGLMPKLREVTQRASERGAKRSANVAARMEMSCPVAPGNPEP